MDHVSGDAKQPLVGPERTPEQKLADLEKEMEDFDNGDQRWPGKGTFEKALETLINEHSMERAGGDTPDFILARYLRLQLDVFHGTVRRRAHWYGDREGLVR